MSTFVRTLSPGLDLGAWSVEGRLPGRDEVARDDPRRDPVVARTERPLKPPAAEQDRLRPLGHRHPERPKDAEHDEDQAEHRQSALDREIDVEERADDDGDDPPDHELIADPQDLLGQDHDREVAGGVGRREGLGRLVDRDARLGQLGRDRRRSGCARSVGRRRPLGRGIIGHRASPVLSCDRRRRWLGCPAAERCRRDAGSICGRDPYRCDLGRIWLDAHPRKDTGRPRRLGQPPV